MNKAVFDDILKVKGCLFVKGCSRGVTLIEVIISIFIVAFMLVGMIRFYSLGNIQTTIARHKMMAMNLAQAEIENLKNTTYEGIVLSNYPLTQIVKIDTGETSGTSDDVDGVMVTEISAINQGCKVIVNISWNDYYGTISEILESAITSYL